MLGSQQVCKPCLHRCSQVFYHIDTVRPLAQAPPNKKFATTLIDNHSKWPELCLTGHATSRAVIEFRRSVLSREEYPEEIVTDNRTQFKSKELEDLLQERGIWHCLSSVYYPQANGLTERFNWALKDFIRLAILEGCPLHFAVIDYLGIYRCTPHGKTGVSPAFLFRGRQPRTRLDIVTVGLLSKDFCNDRRLSRNLFETVVERQWKSKAYTAGKHGTKVFHQKKKVTLSRYESHLVAGRET